MTCWLLYICPEFSEQSFIGNGTRVGQHLPTSGFFCWLPLLAPLVLVKGVVVFVAVPRLFPPCALKQGLPFLTCIFYLLLATFEGGWSCVILGTDSHLWQNRLQGMNKELTGTELSVSVASEPWQSRAIPESEWLSRAVGTECSSLQSPWRALVHSCRPTFHKCFQVQFC